MSISNAVLYPSRYESFSYVACEAMSCGKPVIATRCSALTALVVDGISGYLCDPGDSLLFAKAIQRLSACKKLGEAGRERV